MADFGCRSVLAFWVVSVIVQICFMLNWTSWNFLSTWGLVSIFEKSYKLISTETERAFQEWFDNVWDSVTGRNARGHLRP